MEMSVQELLFTVSMCSFAAGAVMGVVAIHYFVSRDIRAVREDVLGRTRQRALEDCYMQTSPQLSVAQMHGTWEELCVDDDATPDSFDLADTLVRDGGFDLDAAFGFDGLCGFDGKAKLVCPDGEA